MNTVLEVLVSPSMAIFVGTVGVVTVYLRAQPQQQQRKRRQNERFEYHHESEYNRPSVLFPTDNQEIQMMIVRTKEQIYQMRQKYFSKTLSISYTNTTPLMILKGRGCYLYDYDDDDDDDVTLMDNTQPNDNDNDDNDNRRRRCYLDTRNNVAHIGHCHPTFVAAVQQQLSYINTNTRYLHPMTTILAQRLLKTFPKAISSNESNASNSSSSAAASMSMSISGDTELTKVFFCNSGSEANDLALRLARAYFIIQQQRQQKSKQSDDQAISRCSATTLNNQHCHLEHSHHHSYISLIVVDHAYHGHTIATLDASPYKYKKSLEYNNNNNNNNNNNRKKHTTTSHLHSKNDNYDVETVGSTSDGNETREEPPPNTPSQPHQSTFYTRPSFRVHSVPCPNTYRGLYTANDNSDTNTNTTTKISNTSNNAAVSAGELYAQHIQEICNRNQQQQTIDDVNDSHNNSSHCIGTVFMIESGMSVAGVIVPPKNYIHHAVQAVRNTTTTTTTSNNGGGGLYIADEIQTGFGRFGTKYYWGFQYNHSDCMDVAGSTDDLTGEIPNPIPDIVTVGKGFGNGMPLAAVVCNDKVNDAFEELMGHVEVFNTFGGNPVCTTAGYMVMKILEQEQLQQNASSVGAFLIQQLKSLQQQQQQHGYYYIGDVRGCGLFIGVEFVLDPITKIPATKLVSWLCSQLKETYSILSSIDGPYNNVMVIKPPMVFSMDNAKYFISSLQNSIQLDLPKFISKYGSLILQEMTSDDDTTANHTPT